MRIGTIIYANIHIKGIGIKQRLCVCIGYDEVLELTEAHNLTTVDKSRYGAKRLLKNSTNNLDDDSWIKIDSKYNIKSKDIIKVIGYEPNIEKILKQ